MTCASSRSTGDSGGPLLDGGVQVGVVSWSVKPCGQYPGVPDAFSRVSDEYDWIRETACELTSTNAELCKSNKSVKSKKCKKSKKGVMKSMNGMMNSMNGMMKSMKGRK
jgi:secreted trypsin-like serine protease